MAIYGYKAQVFSNNIHTRLVWSYLTHPSTNDRGSMPKSVFVCVCIYIYIYVCVCVCVCMYVCTSAHSVCMLS